MAIIETTDQKSIGEIRNLVGLAFDATDIPDATIAQDVFLGEANLYIEKEVTDHASKTGDDLKILQIAVMKRAAVNILAAAQRTQRFQVESATAEMAQLSPSEAITHYSLEIAEHIGHLTNRTTGTVVTVVGKL